MAEYDDIKPSIPLPRSITLRPIPQLPLVQSSDMTTNKASMTSSATTDDKSFSIQHAPHRNSWTWKVQDVQTVPMFHPLECTAVVLKDIPLQEISARISTFMRLNSISCSYRSSAAGHVDCLTPCLLKFSVQLWRSNEGSDSDVILEVSRLQGCTIEMQRLRNSLVYAVTTGEQPRLPLDHGMGSRRPSHILREVYEQYIHFKTTDSAQEKSDCKDAFLIAIRLLQSNNLDQNRLGMESLCVLTSPSSVCEANADWVAKTIVLGQGELGRKVQSVLTNFFQKIERPEHGSIDEISYDSDDECGFLDYAQGCSFGVMHNFGLQVLTNSLERLAARKDEYDTVAVDLSCSFWQTVLPALVYNMEVAENRPHEASLAARCIGLLDTLEPKSLHHFKDTGLLPVAMHAYEYGKLHHLTLERESRNLIRSLV